MSQRRNRWVSTSRSQIGANSNTSPDSAPGETEQERDWLAIYMRASSVSACLDLGLIEYIDAGAFAQLVSYGRTCALWARVFG